MDGYNHKLSILLAKVIFKMKNFHVDSKRFQVMKERHERMYRNFKMEAPTQHAMYWTTYMLQEKLWSNEEKLEEIKSNPIDIFLSVSLLRFQHCSLYVDIKEGDLSTFVQEFFNHFYIEGVIHGNVEEEVRLAVKTS